MARGADRGLILLSRGTAGGDLEGMRSTPTPTSETTFDFLFAALPGGGHADPLLSVVRGLTARGHGVRVLAGETLREQVDSAGAEWVPWRRAPLADSSFDPVNHSYSRRPPKSPADELDAVRDDLICGPAADFAADTRAELRRRPADVVASDHMLPGVLIGAEAEGVATAAVAMTFLFIPQWGVPAMGLGMTPPRSPLARARAGILRRVVERKWGQGLPAVNAARTGNGLAPISDPIDLFARSDRVLVLASRALEFPEFAPPQHVKLVGPRLDDPQWADAWTPPPGDERLVLVALSSTWMGQTPVLERIAAALGRLPVRGVITTGPAVDPLCVRAPGNVTVVRSAPHGQVLEHASAIVTHGGHGTVAKALAAGVPLVCAPMGRDQSDVAARVVRAGAGVRMDASAEPAKFAESIGQVLGDPAYARAAGRIAATMADDRREDRAVAELEALAGQSRRGRVTPLSAAAA
jgi:MGT family glycosyltransferase